MAATRKKKQSDEVRVRFLVPSTGFRVHKGFNCFSVNEIGGFVQIDLSFADSNGYILDSERLMAHRHHIEKAHSSLSDYMGLLDAEAELPRRTVKPQRLQVSPPGIGLCFNYLRPSYDGDAGELAFCSYSHQAAIDLVSGGNKTSRQTIVPEGLALMRSDISVQYALLVELLRKFSPKEN